MAASVVVQAQVDPAVKERAAAVLEEMGITISEAIGIFLTRTAEEGALPFEVADDPSAHDAWFRAQVQEALDDRRPPIPSDVVESEFAQRRVAALGRLR